MGLKLMMDGKPLGEFDGTQLITPEGDQHQVNQPDPEQETMTVPLDPEQLRRAGRRAEAHTPSGVIEPVAEPKAIASSEEADAANLEIKVLNKQVEALTQQISALSPGSIRKTEAGDTEIDIKDFIDVKPEDDPHGIARTVKELITGVKSINERVSRVDQFFNYQQFQKHVDGAKEDYKEFFNDEKIGPLAQRMLDSALRTDANNPVPVIVANVIKEIKSAGLNPQDGKLKKDLKTKKTIPPTVRSSDGVSPSITVNKPKSLDDARKQYATWRAARAKASEQGRK